MTDTPSNTPAADSDEQAKMLATILEAPISKFAVNTVRKLDLALSSGVEGLYHFAGGGKLLEYNARRRAVVRRNIHRIVSEIEKMSDEEITQAPMAIEASIIEKLSVTEDENISDILSKLLVAAFTKDQCFKVHPSLIDAASNISPDEALILNFISNYGTRIMMIKAKYSDRRPKKSGQYVSLRRYQSVIDNIDGLHFPEKVEFYIGNLISLGLFVDTEGFLSVEKDGVNVPAPEYERLENELKKTSTPPSEHHDLNSTTLILEPTDKGKLLMDVLSSIKLSDQKVTV